jgi:ABC-type transporter Mla subunit MlaD
VARIPGIDNLFSVLQSQSEALSALPRTVESLTTAVRGLADTVAQARETLATVHRLATRLDGLVEELEEPLRAVAPGLTRLAKVLDDPVVEDLPDTLRKVQADLLPVLRTVADTHERVAFIAGSTERMMGFVEDTSRTFSGLPGASLLGGRRRPAGRPAAGPAGGAAGSPPSALPADTVEGELLPPEDPPSR